MAPKSAPPEPSFSKLLGPFWGAKRIPAKARGAILVLTAGCLLIGGFQYAWNRWGEASTRGQAYTVATDAVKVTPQPTWLQVDVKTETLRDANLAGSSLRDSQLVDKFVRAFAAHRWVEQVTSVQKKFPAEVAVELAYRKPIAVVEVFKADGKPGLVFVDRTSALLAHADMAPGALTTQQAEEFGADLAKKYLRITAGKISAAGKIYGHPWENASVAGAAAIAHAWGDEWQAIGLYRIAVTEDNNADVVYELLTKENARVIWGHAPGKEVAGEPSAKEKILRIQDAGKKYGSLDAASAQKISLDFRPSRAQIQAAQKASKGSTR